MKIKKLYWSASASWYIENDSLFINGVKYSDDIKELFPKFYFMTVKGLSVTELLENYRDKDTNSIIMFIEKLKGEKILVNSLDDLNMLFSSQNRIYKDIDNSGDAVKASPEEREKFTNSALRRKVSNCCFPVKLENIPAGDLINRKSVRIFDKEKKISFHQLSALLSAVREYENKKYLYPSGGGLYPVDIYVFVKENRVENLSQGLYLFIPYENKLAVVDIPEGDFKEAHYFSNRDIHESSAFSVYLVYNAEYSMPKYDGLGYYLGIADGGIISQALTIKAFSEKIGSCIIGEMNFDEISEYFHLSPLQKYLHCIEFGIEKKGL
ncbi:MAG: SagB/ThcOx family dehydrogenase [Ruminococcus sp.]|nr:SagB/ThcOx family dehydrogenase [Ruminococcus sp.]